jgi:GNAT superfamily N-acetyltransferase
VTTERGVLAGMRHSRVIVAVHRNRIVGSLRLTTKKPWAIDRSMITPVKRPLYLVGMAVAPDMQRKGIGALLMRRAEEVARDWPAQSIVLDAYDAEAGAGDSYAKYGYREIGRKAYKGDPLRYYELLL